jgi:acetamidase/formamidase
MRVPVNPSVGLIATTPTEMQQTASDSGPYGGNIDMQELIASNMIRLTVFVAGGLLGRGDCHVVVGDGAVGGQERSPRRKAGFLLDTRQGLE